ncbi:MAG: site-specific integrase [Bacteroidales bacterium]|nr:site-specific integrase [Bacteroidales bacterium]
MFKLFSYITVRRQKRLECFLKEYLDNYSKKDLRVMKQAINRYHKFTKSLPGSIGQLDTEHIRMFIDYLSQHSRGSGAHSTYSRFKKAIAAAVSKGILKTDPCTGIRCPQGSTTFMKDTLSEDEIRILMKSPVPSKYEDIKKAFMLCLYSGLRFCDVKALRFQDIDLPNLTLRFTQAKTRSSSTKAVVYIPIREDTLPLLNIGRMKDSKCLIYNLPSHPTCTKILKKWTREAGITKHITWHCARHSFATNLLKGGADIRVVADLLGHSSLKYVEIYTRATDHRKIVAINNLTPFVPGTGTQQVP